MSKKTGVWLDRRRAYIVRLKEDDHQLKIVESDADFGGREENGGKRATRFGSQYGTKQKAKEARLEHQLKTYYKTIAEALPDTGELYIFGPAEAKNELNKTIMEHNHTSVTISGIENADKLTENQIVAAVKDYFHS